MRKLEQQTKTAFENQQEKKVGNTHTDGQSVWLHGNLIIERRDDGVYVTDAGWNTVTTRSRLTSIVDANVYSRKGQLHINNEPWDGEFIRVDAVPQSDESKLRESALANMG